MRRYYIVSGILHILPVIDFAIAAPALVQEKRQAGVDVVHIPGDPITMLGKRGGEGLEKLAEEFFKTWGKPIESSDARPSSGSPPSGPPIKIKLTNLKKPLFSIPEEPSPVSSPEHTPPPSPGSLTESPYELMKGDAALGSSSPGSSTMSSADHESIGAHAMPNSGPLTESDHEMVDVLPLPGSASSTEFDHEMVDVPPSNPVSSTNPDRQSMGPGSTSGKRLKT